MGWHGVVECDEYFPASLALGMCNCTQSKRKYIAIVSHDGLFDSHPSPKEGSGLLKMQRGNLYLQGGQHESKAVKIRR